MHYISSIIKSNLSLVGILDMAGKCGFLVCLMPENLARHAEGIPCSMDANPSVSNTHGANSSCAAPKTARHRPKKESAKEGETGTEGGRGLVPARRRGDEWFEIAYLS